MRRSRRGPTDSSASRSSARAFTSTKAISAAALHDEVDLAERRLVAAREQAESPWRAGAAASRRPRRHGRGDRRRGGRARAQRIVSLVLQRQRALIERRGAKGRSLRRRAAAASFTPIVCERVARAARRHRLRPAARLRRAARRASTISPFTSRSGVARGELGERAAIERLVDLGQLAAERRLRARRRARPRRRQAARRCGSAIRRGRASPAIGARLRQGAFAAPRLRRQEAEEENVVGRQARRPKAPRRARRRRGSARRDGPPRPRRRRARAPGSETSGVPASETSATERPSAERVEQPPVRRRAAVLVIGGDFASMP